MIVYVNLVLNQSLKPYRLITIQMVKRTTLFLIQLAKIGDDIKEMVAPP